MASILLGAILFLLLFALWEDGAFLPRWIIWESKTLTYKSEPYEIRLKHRQAQVWADGALLWTSPDNLRVQQALYDDIDNDGGRELILLCWKKGRYGKHRPFWVSQDENRWSQHLFVYSLSNDKVRSKWGSSYIGQDVRAMAVRTRQDSRNHLLLTAPDGVVSSWVWDSWGFTRENTQVSFVVFGDNLIHEPIYRYGLNHGADFDFLFENFTDLIAQSDVAVINQETPLVEEPSQYGDYPLFGTPIEVGRAIKDAGFQVVTCATNHALDRGASGIRTTWNFFDSNGITCLGIQPEEDAEYRPYTMIRRNNIRLALLNYTYGTNGIRLPAESPYMVHLLKDEEQIRADLEAARAAADAVIVFAHWGSENSDSIDDFQKKWTTVFLESGVDVVVGTHPHVLQPCELLSADDGHSMLVFYSIGNYISAQSEPQSRKGGMASFTLSLTEDGYAVTDYSLQALLITAEKGGRYTVDIDRP